MHTSRETSALDEDGERWTRVAKVAGAGYTVVFMIINVTEGLGGLERR